MKFAKKHVSLTVRQLLHLYDEGKVNLNPGFQRRSVWKVADQRQLIDTILKQMPLPNLFFWERKDGNRRIFDVIDGKQRMEALLAFTRQRNHPIEVKFDPEGNSLWHNQDAQKWTWKEIEKYEPKVYRQFLAYEFPVVQITGTLPEVEQVFVRINSTGTRLTRQEIRHAKWYANSELLIAANHIAKMAKYEKYFTDMGILSEAQQSRMKAVELIVELMLSIQKEDVLDRKKSIDRVMEVAPINGNTLKRLQREVISMLDLIRGMFPDLKTSRFCKASDFYSLFFVLWSLRRDGYVLKDPDASRLAFLILNDVGLDLANFRAKQREGESYKLKSEAKAYYQTIMEGTDSAANRRARNKIIDQLIRPVFPKKDSQRFFTKEHKQILWNKTKDQKCPVCRVKLSWHDVHIDHITPHSKGGRTSISNGQLLCSKCNQIKGAQ